jgi:hypothetical protein
MTSRIFVALTATVLILSPGRAQNHPPEPSPDNVERWEGDNAFSRGFGMTNHSFSFDWFDSHIHLAYSHYPNRLKGAQIREVIDKWFGMTRVYQSGRAILLDPYLETMEWAKSDPRVHVFWWLDWDQAGQLPEIKRRVQEGLIQGLKLHTGDFRKKKGDYRMMGSEQWRAVYSYCEQAELPIVLHLNEHWGDQRYTYGKGAKEFWAIAGYTNQELLDYFLRELAGGHSKVKWILTHMNFQGCPYRDFCIQYADRIMFGTDAFAYHPLPSEYPGHLRNWWLPHQIFLMQLRLPQRTLDQVTHGTAEAVLGRYLKTRKSPGTR